jgi:hypothetical protein
MGALFKRIIAFNNLDDEEKELNEKTENKLIEIKSKIFYLMLLKKLTKLLVLNQVRKKNKKIKNITIQFLSFI